MKKLFNDGWTFSLNGDEPKSVQLPHDWLIYDTSRLYESGVGHYRKKYHVSAGDLIKRHEIIFDGVYMDTTVYVNGGTAGEWKYGYTAFSADMTAFLREGENIIEVRVNHQAPNTRWYSGAGIYRNVYLNVQGSDRIINDGVYISAKKSGGSKWELTVTTETAGNGTARHTLLDADGNTVKEFDDGTVTISDPFLWDTENPHVYRLRTECGDDCEENPMGFRTIEFSSDKGFFLNGRHMKLHGVCQHHDLGAFGAAFDKGAARRQLEILLDMGVNAIRTAHNPPAREYLDLCDELGLLVIDELTDIWELPKNKNDYARFFPEWHERDTASWIRRDRNHPCVIMWSIGNEILDTHRSERGREIAAVLRDLVHKHDPAGNAEVTIGSNFMPFENAQKTADELKLAGYNYAENLYDAQHEQYPDWFIYGSENSSAVRSRGNYRFPVELPRLTFEDRQCSDLGNSVVGWGTTAENAWIQDRDRPWCGGQFIWTGTDYIGEPTPYQTKNSYFGAVDTAGLPKAVFWFYRSVWNKKCGPFIRLFPHWDWNEGQLIDIIAYSNIEEAELFLNGKSLGRQQIDHAKGEKLHYHWKVPYEKGEIAVKAYKDGAETANDVKRTPGEAVKLETESCVTKEGTGFIRVWAVDEAGVPVENARNRVYAETGDGAELLGMDNGDSSDYDSYKGDNRRLFGGQLVAVVRGDVNAVNFRCSAEFAGDAELKAETPVRRIEITADRLTLDKTNPSARVAARAMPENADYTDITWSCVLDTGAKAEIASISGDGMVTATGDGKFKVRAVCMNGSPVGQADGTPFPQIISELDMKAEGIGEASKNAYSFISASLYDISDAPLKIIEQGSVAGVNKVKTLIGFKNVDFGKAGADLLRLYIGTTSYYDEVLVDVIVDGRELETLSFPRNNLHYSYEAHEFRIREKLTGKRDVCFTVDRRCVFGGFGFVDERVFNPIYAGEKDEIYGDNYIINGDKIENIGNNVIITFRALDFGEKKPRKIVICGHAPKGNSIECNIAGNAYMFEFAESGGYCVQEFDAWTLGGVYDANFTFLPGSDFNFEWFKFI